MELWGELGKDTLFCLGQGQTERSGGRVKGLECGAEDKGFLLWAVATTEGFRRIHLAVVCWKGCNKGRLIRQTTTSEMQVSGCELQGFSAGCVISLEKKTRSIREKNRFKKFILGHYEFQVPVEYSHGDI